MVLVFEKMFVVCSIFRLLCLRVWLECRLWSFVCNLGELSIVGWNIFLCIVLGFMLSSALYFVMAVLQLIVVCLIIILCASIFAFRPMLAICSTHCVCSMGFVGRGGRFGLVNRVRDCMSEWFWRWVWG